MALAALPYWVPIPPAVHKGPPQRVAEPVNWGTHLLVLECVDRAVG